MTDGEGAWRAGSSGMLGSMAYDGNLGQRIRERLAGIPSLREVKMFGGLSFMVDGHIVAFGQPQRRHDGVLSTRG